MFTYILITLAIIAACTTWACVTCSSFEDAVIIALGAVLAVVPFAIICYGLM